jgi:hypothetical protein
MRRPCLRLFECEECSTDLKLTIDRQFSATMTMSSHHEQPLVLPHSKQR